MLKNLTIRSKKKARQFSLKTIFGDDITNTFISF